MTFRSRLALGPAMLLGGTVVGYALSFGTSVIQARLLGPEGRGVIATAATPGVLIGILLCLNVQDYLGREAARGVDSAVLSRQAAGLAMVGGGIFVIPYVLLVSTWQRPGTTVWLLLIGYIVATPVTIYMYCLVAIASGRGRWAVLAVSRVLPGLLVLIGLGVAALLGWGPLEIGVLVLVASLIGTGLPLALQSLPLRGPWLHGNLAAIRFGIRAWPAGALALVSQRIDLLIVVALASRSEVGIYAMATNMAAVLTAVSNVVAMPTRNAVARGDIEVVSHRVGTAVWATAVLAGVAVVVLPAFIQGVLGRDFRALFLPAAILIAAEIPLAAAVVLNQVLVGAGKPSKPLAGAAAAMVVTGAGAVALFPIAGMTGVALACLCGNAANMTFQLRAVRRHVVADRFASYLIPRVRVERAAA